MTIMAIGGHIGDMELTCGGYLATASLRGDSIVTVALTAGEKGNPPGQSVAEYRKQKVREAEGFAQMLGGKAIVFGHADGELPLDDAVAYELGDIIRREKPDLLITHWNKSIHKDHIFTSQLAERAQYYAGVPGFERDLPAHFARGPYFAENWEDPEDFTPRVYVEVSEDGFALWQKAIDLHWFTTHSTSFAYKEYYSHLKALRGIEVKKPYAEAFEVPILSRRNVVDAL